ncbi:MAG: hypothetical protein Q8N60_01720, partial [Candidatus Diapherotrites archaeon]|nr:hypothetical protein [Candidatus Diapherotrites archaeon]
HPLQKTVSIAEALQWFGENGIEFVAAKPEIEKRDRGKKAKLLFIQLRWLLHGEDFFTVAGQKARND